MRSPKMDTVARLAVLALVASVLLMTVVIASACRFSRLRIRRRRGRRPGARHRDQLDFGSAASPFSDLPQVRSTAPLATFILLERHVGTFRDARPHPAECNTFLFRARAIGRGVALAVCRRYDDGVSTTP